MRPAKWRPTEKARDKVTWENPVIMVACSADTMSSPSNRNSRPVSSSGGSDICVEVHRCHSWGCQTIVLLDLYIVKLSLCICLAVQSTVLLRGVRDMWAWRGIFRKTLSGNYYVKFGHFSGKYHVKFGYFVKFACIYFPAKVLPPKLTELLWHTHMVLITYSGKHFSRQLLCKIWAFFAQISCKIWAFC